jgi:hypothetical protein
VWGVTGRRTLRWRLSKHARVELMRRGIPLSLVAEVIANPQQIVAGRNVLKTYQSKIVRADGRVLLLRIVVDDTIEPMVVVTAYRTSKVDKYWRDYEDLV